MPVILEPLKSIVPIVRSTKEMPVIEVLGTGFFVGIDSDLHLITAKHVIEDNPLKDGERYAVAFREDKGIRVVASSRVIGSPNFDLAACQFSIRDLPEAVTLPVSKVEPSLNDDVLSFEFSSTRFIRKPAGGTHVSFEPNAHKGNIVRSFTSSFPEKQATPSYLVSFPALQGASGAPLFFRMPGAKKTFAVVGMIVANVERHLLPAQMVQIQDGDDYNEKTSYFLPYGKALARTVIVQCLEEMGVPFSSAEDEDVEKSESEARGWSRLWALLRSRRDS